MYLLCDKIELSVLFSLHSKDGIRGRAADRRCGYGFLKKIKLASDDSSYLRMARYLILIKSAINEETSPMNRLNRLQVSFSVALLMTVASGLFVLVGCAPLETRPTLSEVRTGGVQGPIASDASLHPAEIRAEVIRIDPARRELQVQTDGGRQRIVFYEPKYTTVTYHGRPYSVEQLESGDIIAFQPTRWSRDDIATIRILDPVQARTGSPVARAIPPPPRSEIVEGTVERVQYDLGVFDLQPRSGRSVTVSIPYNARPGDVESFRRLRRGDYVRVEGEFVNPDSLQLLAFLSPRGR